MLALGRHSILEDPLTDPNEHVLEDGSVLAGSVDLVRHVLLHSHFPEAALVHQASGTGKPP